MTDNGPEVPVMAAARLDARKEDHEHDHDHDLSSTSTRLVLAIIK